MSGGPFGWIGEGVAEIGNQFNKVFSSDEAPGSKSGATQARTNRVSESSNSGKTRATSIDGYQRAGGASNGQRAWSQAFEFDPNTDDVNTKLTESGCKGKAGIYLIRDKNDERTLYVGKAEATTSTDILSRLKSHLTGAQNGNSGIRERIEKGETLTIRWVECDNPTQYESVAMAYLLPTDNKKVEHSGTDKIRIQEEMAIAILLDLPSFWHANYEEMVKEAKEQGLSVAGYGTNRVEVAEAIFWQCNKETKENYDNPRGSGGSEEGLLGGLISSFVALFDSNSDRESSVTSDKSRSDSENSNDSWFGNWFGGPSESSSDNGSGDDESGDYRDSRSSDNGSNDSWFGNWFGGSSESSSDNGSGDDRSGDYGDSGASNSSSSNSDSWW